METSIHILEAAKELSERAREVIKQPNVQAEYNKIRSDTDLEKLRKEAVHQQEEFRKFVESLVQNKDSDQFKKLDEEAKKASDSIHKVNERLKALLKDNKALSDIQKRVIQEEYYDLEADRGKQEGKDKMKDKEKVPQDKDTKPLLWTAVEGNETSATHGLPLNIISNLIGKV